jgi:hypothetical protein
MKNIGTLFSLDTKASLNNLRHTHEEQAVMSTSLKYHTFK